MQYEVKHVDPPFKPIKITIKLESLAELKEMVYRLNAAPKDIGLGTGFIRSFTSLWQILDNLYNRSKWA